MTMMTLLATAFAGVVVAVTPGPAVLALLGIGAGQGRRAAAAFLAGHFLGDVIWAALALVTLVWASVLERWVIDGLAYACAAYLLYLGLRALFARKGADGDVNWRARRPGLRGMALGLTNPKSYPLALAMLAAMAGGELAALTPAGGAVLLAAYMAGFVIGDAIDVWLVGTPLLRGIYRRFEIAVVRTTGVLFIGFAVNTARSAAGN
jgi:threonine/homoserine/homoserine lactone efflux protein